MAEETSREGGNLSIGTLVVEENWDGIGERGCHEGVGG